MTEPEQETTPHVADQETDDWMFANGVVRSVIDEMLQIEKQGLSPESHLVWSWRIRLSNAYNNIFYWGDAQAAKEVATEYEHED